MRNSRCAVCRFVFFFRNSAAISEKLKEKVSLFSFLSSFINLFYGFYMQILVDTHTYHCNSCYVFFKYLRYSDKKINDIKFFSKFKKYFCSKYKPIKKIVSLQQVIQYLPYFLLSLPLSDLPRGNCVGTRPFISISSQSG